MLHHMAEDDDFSNKLIFSDEATFFLRGKVNRHNVRIWGTENPRVYVEHTRNSPKLNVCCALPNSKVYSPFFLLEPTVSGHSYLDMLEQWPMPQLETDGTDFIYQQDGAPPHFHNEVRQFLNNRLPNRELRDRIINAIAAIDMDTLHRAWDELDYRLDICRVTRGAHIEHL
ncbi:hypothetical protein C0J52_15049 [Blattella germanica]|nr:hypothetical protein C0J52_15049 [Blattella germanica]